MNETTNFAPGPIALFFVMAIPLIVLQFAGLWKIFTKAGRPGWEAIIPFYNMYVLLQIVGKPAWWLVLMLIPVLNVIFITWTYNMLSKSFGKDEAFTVGIVLLSFIFLPILGFGSSKYIGPYGDSEAFQKHSLKGYEFGKD